MTLNKKIGASAVVVALSCAGPALAADLPSRVAPPAFVPPPIVNAWDGLYAGTTYGYGWTNFRTSQFTSGSHDQGGTTGGALIGYNFQTGHWVYGAEASIDVDNADARIGGKLGLTQTQVDSLYDIRLRGRLGYEFGRFMPFIAGGAVINETYQRIAGPYDFFGDTRRSTGWTVGGGVDVKINPRDYLPFLPSWFFGPLIFRAEYIHDSLPNQTYTIGGPFAGFEQFRTKSDTNLVRAAIIYRFGETAPRPYVDSLGQVNWGGGYGGVFGGYESTRIKAHFPGVTTTIKADGGQGGIYAGTNFMLFNNRFMLGLEGATAYSDVSGNGHEPLYNDPVHEREYVAAEARGRAGYAFGAFLPFVAAGVSFTRDEERDTFTNSEKGRINRSNFMYGGGLDYRISERMSVRAEYIRESSFHDRNVDLNGCPVPACKQSRDADLFRFGAAYHFE